MTEQLEIFGTHAGMYARTLTNLDDPPFADARRQIRIGEAKQVAIYVLFRHVL